MKKIVEYLALYMGKGSLSNYPELFKKDWQRRWVHYDPVWLGSVINHDPDYDVRSLNLREL